METNTIPKKVLRNKHVLISRIKTRWPFLIWLFAVFFALFAYFHGGQFGGITGTVFTQMENVAPQTTGRLNTLFVKVGDPVKKGDVLAEIDSLLLMEKKTLTQTKMHSVVANLQSEEIQNLRRFDASIIRLKSELRDLQIKQIEAQSNLTALKPEFKRLSKLVKQKLVDEKEIMPIRMKIRTLEILLKSYPTTVKELNKSLVEAKKQKKTISKQSKQAIKLVKEEAKQSLHFLEMKIEACKLRAYKDGVVSRIYYYPGNIVPAGETVVANVVKTQPRIIGFLSEYNARDVTVGMKAFLTPVSGYGPVIEANVSAITPEIYSLPTRAQPVAGQSARGRRVVISVTGENELLPGESVEIRFSRPWTTRILWNLFSKDEKETK